MLLKYGLATSNRRNSSSEERRDFIGYLRLIISTGVLLFSLVTSSTVKRDSSVGVATRYGLGGLGIEFGWGRDFLHPSRPVGPPSLLYNGYWVFPGGKAAEAWP